MRRTAAVLVVLFWCGLGAQSPDPSTLQQLYGRHAWFELREAMTPGAGSALYRGALASAFNRTADAEQALDRAVRDAASVDAATEAREALINLYLRAGHTRDAMRIVDAALAAAPARSDFRNLQALFDPLRRAANQTVRFGRGNRFACSVAARGLYFPASVNGKRVTWFFDSAFSTTAVTESEARMLGIPVSRGVGEAGDFTGATTTTRAAVIDRLVIGDAELRNVPVLVFADSQPPWSEQPPGQRGTIGLPVAVALHALRWTADGACYVGPTRGRRTGNAGNLAFDGITPVTRANLDGRPVDLVVDTGNQAGTQLWERFARDFPALVSRGRRTTRQLQQIGGSRERDVVELPGLLLRIGGFDVQLQRVAIFSSPVGDTIHHGNVGFDVFGRAAEVTMDFDAMSLIIR